MKLRKPVFKKYDLSSLLFYLYLPESEETLELIKKVKKDRPNGILISKGKEGYRFRFKVDQDKDESLQLLADSLSIIKKQGKDLADAIIDCSFTYDPEKYATDPELPLQLPESSENKKVILTGVKMNFPEPTSNLKFTIVDLQYCINCGKCHGIGNKLVLRESILINGDFVINSVKKAREYSEAFVKSKEKKSGGR